jgi:hypothetical protein
MSGEGRLLKLRVLFELVILFLDDIRFLALFSLKFASVELESSSDVGVGDFSAAFSLSKTGDGGCSLVDSETTASEFVIIVTALLCCDSTKTSPSS